MEKLAEIVDSLATNEKVNKEFRLWLTSTSSNLFPVSILQSGIKITSEPPRGIRANLQHIYREIFQSRDALMSFNSGEYPGEWRKMHFALSFFHALIVERRKFGPLGWNICYGFNESDLKISSRQLKNIIESSHNIPYEAIQYIIGSCNYGGRITDPWDSRIVHCLLSNILNEDILENDAPILGSSIYHVLGGHNDVEDYITYIEKLPVLDSPEIFGLHENARITCARNETSALLSNLMRITPRNSGASADNRNEILSIVDRISSMITIEFNLEKVKSVYPIDYEFSMHTVLLSELEKFNNLTKRIHSSLSDLRASLEGIQVITPELERLSHSLLKAHVPALWAQIAYPSRKALMSWIADLEHRLTFFDSWVLNGTPAWYWISGFFFIQSFLTGQLQSYARQRQIPIDSLKFDFEILSADEDLSTLNQPEHGCYIHGLYLEGARWNEDTHLLAEQYPRELYSIMPIIHLKQIGKMNDEDSSNRYLCPVYKTSQRSGTLSSTGHSTNYVLTVHLPSEEPPHHWITRGVALITSLDN